MNEEEKKMTREVKEKEEEEEKQEAIQENEIYIHDVLQSMAPKRA